MTIYFINNKDFELETESEYLDDLYYIKSDKPLFTKEDIYVTLFNIIITTSIFYFYLGNNI
jgi:hypothetical protein